MPKYVYFYYLSAHLFLHISHCNSWIYRVSCIFPAGAHYLDHGHNMHAYTHFVHIRWKLDEHKETSLRKTKPNWSRLVITSGQNSHM